ncbi:MAG: hypothetical protein QW328_08025 [Nitrososphaerota archaeon]
MDETVALLKGLLSAGLSATYGKHMVWRGGAPWYRFWGEGCPDNECFDDHYPCRKNRILEVAEPIPALQTARNAQHYQQAKRGDANALS